MKTNSYNSLKPEIGESKYIRAEKELAFKGLFNKQFARFLLDNNVSAKELSDLTGYTVQHCSNIIKGTSTKSLSLFCLYRICEALDVSPTYLWDFDHSLNDVQKDKSINSKRQTLINKINKIDDEKILNKLLSDVNFLNNYSEKVKNENIDDNVEY